MTQCLGRAFAKEELIVARESAQLPNAKPGAVTAVTVVNAVSAFPSEAVCGVAVNLSAWGRAVSEAPNAQHEAVRRGRTPAFTTVTAVATRFGVWELGPTARDYQLLFGERPSETLRLAPFSRCYL